MPRSLAIVVAVALACAREAAQAPVAVAADAAMRHYDIRFEQLPPPFATPSAGNPPIVTPRPVGAMLHLPPGFSINEYASGLDDPRAMLLLTNGDVLLAEPGAGHVLLLRDANHDGIAEVRYLHPWDPTEAYGDPALVAQYAAPPSKKCSPAWLPRITKCPRDAFKAGSIRRMILKTAERLVATDSSQSASVMSSMR